MTELLATNRPASLLATEFPLLAEGLGWLASAVEVLAVVVMVVGVARFLLGFLGAELAGDARGRRIDAARRDLGRYILAGLEVLIVSDIVHTAVSMQLTDLVFLGLLVIIRSVISYFLGREIEGLEHEDEARTAGQGRSSGP